MTAFTRLRALVCIKIPGRARVHQISYQPQLYPEHKDNYRSIPHCSAAAPPNRIYGNMYGVCTAAKQQFLMAHRTGHVIFLASSPRPFFLESSGQRACMATLVAPLLHNMSSLIFKHTGHGSRIQAASDYIKNTRFSKCSVIQRCSTVPRHFMRHSGLSNSLHMINRSRETREKNS